MENIDVMTPENIKALRQRIGAAQNKKRFSLHDMARFLGMDDYSFTTIYRWEHGKHTPKGEYRRKLAGLFKEYMPELFNGAKVKPPEKEFSGAFSKEKQTKEKRARSAKV